MRRGRTGGAWASGAEVTEMGVRGIERRSAGYGACMSQESWTLDELHAELERWELELRLQGKAENTIATYIGRTETFLRWLAGDYHPR